MRMRGWIVMLMLSFAVAGVPGCQRPPSAPPQASADKAGASDAQPQGTGTADAKPQGASDAKPQGATDAKPQAAGDAALGGGSGRASVVFAGGCFWCVEAVFEELEGVIEAESGYSGGTKDTANYPAVCTGATGHAEAVRIVYDPAKISYEKLLSVHFATHDPTTLNRQGADAGPQYRSAIFYANDDQKKAAQEMIDRLNQAGVYPRPIVTTLEPLKAFYPAETYHQNYVCDNPYQPYVQGVAMPKVAKVRKLFKDDLKKDKK